MVLFVCVVFMSNVENLKVWQKAIELATQIYSLSKWWKDFGLASQMQRSAVSIPSNISEWCARETDKEYVRFLYIARWSCSELKTQLLIAYNVWYIPSEIYKDVADLSNDIHKMINWLIVHLMKKIKK